jgi:uncharacterized protein (TIGR00251 family)
LRLKLRLQPKSSANRIDGCECQEDGTSLLKCRVTAVPENGKANAALLALLAKAWGIPKSSIAIVSGETSRNKTIEIGGAWGELVMSWVREHATPVKSPPP